MNILKSVLFMVGLLAFSFSVYAVDKSDGCGVGWKVTEKHSFIGTSIRGTTNSFLPPTFSMTSGTSGCDTHTIVKKEKRGIHFAEANFANLEIEMSFGTGEFLSGFAQVMGCGDVQGVFGDVMQKNYQDIYPSEDIKPLQMYHNVLREISEDSVLSSACHSI